MGTKIFQVLLSSTFSEVTFSPTVDAGRIHMSRPNEESPSEYYMSCFTVVRFFLFISQSFTNNTILHC